MHMHLDNMQMMIYTRSGGDPVNLEGQILAKLLEKSGVYVVFPGLTGSRLCELAHSASLQALREIRAVLDDERLDDAECSRKIEKIVTVFESIGSDGGTRHDSG